MEPEDISESVSDFATDHKLGHDKRIIETLNVIIKIENVCGLFRFAFVNGKLREPTWMMKMISLFISITCACLFFYVSINSFHINIDNISVANFLNLICVVATGTQYMVNIMTITFIFNSTNICIITTLANLDVKMKLENIKNFYKKSMLESYKYVISIGIIQVVIISLDALTINVAWALTAGMISFVQRLEIITFCKYIDLLRRRLQIINKYLKTFVNEQDRKSETIFTIETETIVTNDTANLIGDASESNTKIRDLAQMYGMIAHTCSMIGKIFSLQILTILISVFILLITIMYNNLIIYQTSMYVFGRTVNAIVSFSFWLFYFAFMSFKCERLLSVRNETKILVNKIIMNYDLPTTMRDQAKAFMQLVEAWPLRIHIYDMFSVDITLMLKFISVATTYFIIIIQVVNFSQIILVICFFPIFVYSNSLVLNK
ncbi:uncharacterized protein LOC124633852 [Helicoverpa zea]|uniref:uncharacterized protein LOC124633852 n=1 Tax=Helicoverpa zea TaxID=7113 RepID=UPI001F58EFC2|nr:uncharacterized protein LOC124633852 [Helicoverpa zea]